MTTGELLVSLSGLPSATALQHLMAIQVGGSAPVGPDDTSISLKRVSTLSLGAPEEVLGTEVSAVSPVLAVELESGLTQLQATLTSVETVVAQGGATTLSSWQAVLTHSSGEVETLLQVTSGSATQESTQSGATTLLRDATDTLVDGS